MICSMKFPSPETGLYLYNLPYGLARNTVVIHGLALVAAT